MNSISKELFHSTSSRKEFLYGKSCRENLIDFNDKISSETIDNLKKHFPDLLSGKPFTDYAAQWFEPFDAFAAMAVGVDKKVGADGEEKNEAPVDVVIAIDRICKENNGIWGLIENTVFGCFFMGIDENECMELARLIKSDLSKNGSKTVSIGTASFPLIDFKNKEIILNALKALRHAAFFGPDSAVSFDSVSLNINADKLYQEGDIKGAIEDFKKAVILDPENLNVFNGLGVCYGVLGAYEKAEESFEAALKIKPEDSMVLYNAGLVNMLINNRGKALAYMLEADKFKEDVFEVAYQTGKLYLESQEFDKAREYLEKAVEIEPDAPHALRFLGESYAKLNLIDKAVASYKKALKFNPNDAHSLSAMGSLFDIKGENSEITIIFCQQSVNIEPENGLFRHRLGYLYFKQNELDNALREFEKAKLFGYDSSEFIEKINDMEID